MNLVVQGPALARGDLDALSLLAKPQSVREIAPRAELRAQLVRPGRGGESVRMKRLITDSISSA